MQRWLYEQGWTALRDAQERAIDPILSGNKDVVISAATAAGKTEAAFLPICSALLRERDSGQEREGVRVLALSPLKALINDQFDRLEQLCASADIPVHRWHGDVTGSAKRRLTDSPSGVLLITPESLEAMFVLRGTQVARILGGLSYIVIDELHSFLSTARGAQAQSLLNRCQLAVRRKVPRIGLSATLSNMSIPAAFLRPDSSEGVVIIQSEVRAELQLQVRGYRESAPEASAPNGQQEAQEEDWDPVPIVDHMFRTMRGSDNLVFANSRREVERFAERLASKCEAENVPNEFWPHHGSLSREVRTIVEQELKDHSKPTTVVCTSTLEMGIDVGSVASVAQIGCPPSVTSLRQRLGRSGRRDSPPVLRVYVAEASNNARSTIVSTLRCRLVQTIAMVELLLEKWLEPVPDAGLNLSTMIQQVLSLIAQHGGVSAKDLYRVLGGPGPFQRVPPDRFAVLLKDMAAIDLIIQSEDGSLLHGRKGEAMVNHYSFYAAFETPEEWRLVAGGRTLGTLPISQALVVDAMLIFAARRWRVVGVDPEEHIVELVPARGGRVPQFGGGGPAVGDEVRARMRRIFVGDQIPPWLDQGARDLLGEARKAWELRNLARRWMIPQESGMLVLPWMGDSALMTAALLFKSAGFDADTEGPALFVDCSETELNESAQSLLLGPLPAPVELAARIRNRNIEKWDWVLDTDLSTESAAIRMLNLPGARVVLERIVEKEGRSA